MMKISTYINKLLQNNFIKNVSILASGTIVAQIIAFIALPFLTRLYTPNDFSVLAVYNAILAIISVISCLRFEIAIPIPEKDEDAAALLLICLTSVTIITILSILSILIFDKQLNSITDNRLNSFLWIIPISIFIAGIYNSLQYWAIRKKNFKLITRTRLAQSLTGNGSQLGLGYLGLTPLGLIVGQALNMSSGFVSLCRYYITNYSYLNSSLSYLKIKKIFKKYIRFPKYSVPESLTNSGSIQLPIILIAYFAIGAEAGYLMLATRILSSPVGLLGRATAQVYLSEAPNKYIENNLQEFTKKITFNLFRVGFLPIIFIGIIAPYLIPRILGDEWQRAGVLITWMAPWYLMQFITSPVSMALHITNNQKTAMLLQFFGLIIRVGSVVFASIYFKSYLVEFYAVSGFVFYSLYLFIVLKTLKE